MIRHLRPPTGNSFPLRVLRLSGSQAEMGAQHGRLVAEVGDAPSLSSFYADLPARLILGSGAEPSEQAMYRALEPLLDRALRRMEANRRPELRARSRAFLEALGEDPDLSRRLAVMDLFQNLVGVALKMGVDKYIRRLQTAIPGMCSTLMVHGDRSEGGRVLHARNFDFPGIGVWERRPTVVLCSPDEGQRYGFLTTFGADLPGITAFNDAGIMLTAHTRFHKDVSFSGTQVIDLGHEIIRRSETLADAVSVARSMTPIASSWGFAVSSANEGLCLSLETHASRVDVVTEHGCAHACTNHYQHGAQQAGEMLVSDGFVQSSYGRASRLRDVAAAGPLDVRALQRALGSYDDADVPGEHRSAGAVLAQGSSIQSIVGDLAERTIHVSVGPCPTGGGPWVALPLCWDGPAYEEVEGEDDPREDLAGVSGVALGHYVEATRLAEAAEPLSDVRVHLERAVELRPNDPSYRLAAALFAAKAGAIEIAAAHVRIGMPQERSAFVRAQYLLWGSRLHAILGQTAAADEMRTELSDGRWFTREAAGEQTRAFPRRLLKSIRVSLEALDAG